jgi:hypothetical protein
MALEGLITSGYDGVMVCAANMQSGLNLIVASSDPYVEADMLTPWYDNMTNAENATIDLLMMSTQSLLTHVGTRGGLRINDYLSVNNLKVSLEFSSICEVLGQPIDESNIQA